MANVLQLLIDGEFVDAAGGETFPTEDPRTGDVLLDVAEAQENDVDRAVQAARKVQLLAQLDNVAGFCTWYASNLNLADITDMMIAGLRSWPLAKDVWTRERAAHLQVGGPDGGVYQYAFDTNTITK